MRQYVETEISLFEAAFLRYGCTLNKIGLSGCSSWVWVLTKRCCSDFEDLGFNTKTNCVAICSNQEGLKIVVNNILLFILNHSRDNTSYLKKPSREKAKLISNVFCLRVIYANGIREIMSLRIRQTHRRTKWRDSAISAAAILIADNSSTAHVCGFQTDLHMFTQRQILKLLTAPSNVKSAFSIFLSSAAVIAG